MNLRPALTWLQLLPRDVTIECDSGPQWLRAMLSDRQKTAASNGSPTASSRVLVVYGKSFHDIADLPHREHVVMINCSGAGTRRFEAAGFNYARRFGALPNLESARWFLSLDGGAVAAASFNIYTPARKSAHLKKALAQLLARWRVPFWYRDQIVVASRQPPPLERKLAELFPGRKIRIGLSAGAPEPALNRKPSGIVLDSKGRVLAFVKIAGSPLSQRIMEHEAAMLPALAERERLGDASPKLLFTGEIDGRYVTIQSPLPGKPAPAIFTPAHERYLATLRIGPSRSAAATHMVATLPSRIAALHDAGSLDLGSVLDEVMPALESLQVPSTVVHGDFAPWNLRTHNSAISAFDWEYGELDGLPLIDQTHFLIQLGFQLHGWDAAAAQSALKEIAAAKPLGMTPDQVRALHVIYLLDQIVRLRGEGYPADDEMVEWYLHVLDRLIASKREAVLA